VLYIVTHSHEESEPQKEMNAFIKSLIDRYVFLFCIRLQCIDVAFD
jgi:hypothetical protein